MKKKSSIWRTLIMNSILFSSIIATFLLLNKFFPLNFSGYFAICAVSLLLCITFMYGKKSSRLSQQTLLIPWALTFIASVIVTTNYLRPDDARVYSNADAHTLALKGVSVKDSLILISDDKTNSLLDNNAYEGYLSIKPIDSVHCSMRYDVIDIPIYLRKKHATEDSLLNAAFLPAFEKALELRSNELSCKIEITEKPKNKRFLGRELPKKVTDTLFIKLKYSDSKNEYIPLLPTQAKTIKMGYNLYDLIHAGIAFTESEEVLIANLKNIYLLRDFNSKKFYITYNKQLANLKVLCDGHLYRPQHTSVDCLLAKEDYIHVGIGDISSRSLTFISDGNHVKMHYQFPYLYNFPRYATQDNSLKEDRKNLAISSSANGLLMSDVKEAFFFNLFENNDNNFHFDGFINYKVSNSRTPFKYSIVDNAMRSDTHKNTLLSTNKAEWEFAVYDLRKQSPITGQDNLYLNEFFIVGIIILMFLFSFIGTLLFFTNPYKAGIVMGIWLFITPIFVLRFYLLWRIAVFPPLTDIKLEALLRYRMENAQSENAMWWTLLAISLLMAFTVIAGIISFLSKKLHLSNRFSVQRINIKRFLNSTRWRQCIIIILWFVTTMLLLVSGIVLTNIVLPVLTFFAVEYIAYGKISYKWRVANSMLTFGILCKGDPGYAVMFFIFLCTYFIIHIYSFQKSRKSNIGNVKLRNGIWISLLVVLGAIVFFSADIVTFAYDHTSYILTPSLTYNTVFFIVIYIILITIIGIAIWHRKANRSKWAIVSLIVSLLLPFILFYGGNYVLEDKPHMKYRAFVHTQTVSEIMEHEDFGERNSERLIEASANQWFIQYQNNKGSERVFSDGLFSLSPHFKKGVSWSTQISDVIVARYIVGEISSFFPSVLLIFALIFLVLMFRNRTKKESNRSLGYAVALLLVIQMTFVWMAATNRMIFFGQDFPFLSQNARVIMLMFVVLLGIPMLLSYPEANGNNKIPNDLLSNFSKHRIPAFFGTYFAVFILLYLFGNRYASLYSEHDGRDSGNATEYNLSRMMSRCKADIDIVNKKLSSSQIKASILKDNEDISTKFNKIDNEIHLTEYVNQLAEQNEISQFTQSMYKAFCKNLLSHNSVSNIIHLKRTSSGAHYEFALNNGFYSFKSPDYEEKAWKGHIYSENVHYLSSFATALRKYDVTIYSIPESWTAHGNGYGIVDCRKINRKNMYHDRILHTTDIDYLATFPIYPIKTGERLEVISKSDGSRISFRYGQSQEDILVKNMIINGKHRYFYPLAEKCFWLKDFSDLASFCLSEKSDSLIVTLDGQLTSEVSDILKQSGKNCSVIALDGKGNVRLMADNRDKRYMLDPNDEESISYKVIENYLNPNSAVETNLFGNMNLSYLNPGPGSSLKPITYAAVTSQSQYFPWERLILLPPSVYSDNTITESGKYWLVRKYGPKYVYPHKNEFKSIKGDENGVPFRGVDNKFYLAKSSNYYNALVTYLGNYGNLKGYLQNIFRPAEALDYPKIKLDGIVYAFKNAPEDVFSNENTTLLLNGLHHNFSIPTHMSYSDTLRFGFVNNEKIRKNGYSPQRLASLFPWVYPSNSSIMDYELNNEFPSPASQVKQYTLGSYPLHITPLKMAEMYGKLFSLHPDFRATITPNNESFKKQWVNEDGAFDKNIWDFYKHNLFSGMAECVNSGTAKPYLKALANNTPYYYYAKTGTLLGQGATSDDRMLAVVITNKKIVGDIQPSDIRFYVLYFYYKRSGSMPNVEKVVREVINSRSFTHYMNS